MYVCIYTCIYIHDYVHISKNELQLAVPKPSNII